MTLTHLAHVAILVDEYDAGIAFFVGVLGFELREDTDLGGGKRWIRVAPPGASTELLIARAVGAQRTAIGRQFGGRVGFFLHSDNVSADHARLSAAGVLFEELPRREPYGQVAVFRDPWGNRWDLLGPA